MSRHHVSIYSLCERLTRADGREWHAQEVFALFHFGGPTYDRTFPMPIQAPEVCGAVFDDNEVDEWMAARQHGMRRGECATTQAGGH